MRESVIIYSTCPGCASPEIHPALHAIDYTVSKEEFAIWHCDNCTLRFTQGVPGIDAIQDYYRADSYISHTNTRKGLINQLYHLVRKKTLNDKRLLIRSAVKMKSGSILDIGAGTGAFVRHMQVHGWEAAGLEPDAKAREQALSQHGVQLRPVNQLTLLQDQSFDAISMWHVLEHVHDLQGTLSQLKRIIRPEGYVFIAVPNYTSYDARFYKNFWAAYDTPRHLYHFSPDAMRFLLHQQGLQLHAIQPMWFDSFYVSLLSEKYKTGRSNLIGGFYRGAISNLKALVNREQYSSLIYVIGL